MSRSIIHRLSYMLILGAILVFAGIGIYGVPRLLNAQVEITQPFEPESREQNLADKAPLGEVAVLVNTPVSSPTPPNTATPPPTYTPVNTATPAQSVEKAAPITVSVTLATSPTPQLVETPAHPRYYALATEKTWLFASLDREERWLGVYLPANATAQIIGRSADNQWLHIIHPFVDVQGWISADAVEFINTDPAQLSVSTYSATVPAVTERPVAIAAVQSPTQTPLPQGRWTNTASTAWQAATPIPTKIIWPTKPSQQQTWPTATTQWQPTATPVPATVTPIPTATPQPTRTPAPTQPPTKVAATPLPAPLSESNAVAWWQTDPASLQTNSDGTWRIDLIVRVPTSFSYDFSISYLTQTVLRDRNLEGDDIFVLTLWGMQCGTPLNDELLAYQDGAQMIVQNEFTLEVGKVYINPPCQ